MLEICCVNKAIAHVVDCDSGPCPAGWLGVSVRRSSESSRSLLIVTADARGICEFISMMLCFLRVCVNIWRVELRVSHCSFALNYKESG